MPKGESMEPTENRRNPGKQKKYYDYTLLFMVIVLIVIGIIMISSISAYNAAKYEGSATFYTDRQILYAVVGVVLMVVLSLVDYRLYAIETPVRKWPLLIVGAYLLIAAAQAAVIVLGKTGSDANGAVNGASRWIAVGGFKIQPGEFAKLFVIVIAAYWLCRVVTGQHRVRDTIFFLAGMGAIAVLALVESMTTAIVLIGITAGLLFVCSRKKLLFVILAAAVLLGAFLFVQYMKTQDAASGGFRMRRVNEWIHLDDKDNDGQVKQGLYAVASGGLFGKGFGQSAQKLGHIPEVHTDMIFACIVEELGLVGGAAILILFAVLLWRIAIIAINAQELYGTLLCYGVMLHIGLQVCINVAVVTGTIPSTGVTLPFISYGGSSLLVLCAECGVVLNVSRNIGERKNIAILEYLEPAGANRRNQKTDGYGEGGLVTVKNEPTGRKRPKRRPFGLFGSGESGRRSARNAEESRKKNEKSGSRKKTTRKTGKTSAAERLLASRQEERKPAAGQQQTEPQNTSGRYSMDVELGKPIRRDSDE
ncbi:MAG: FtsW/RodA/SpoVE family cell cycle protein [Lachnospiraceae bacterium]|nr:FtsW/RodA/SpoVE family cell cycle protein [Lachnospiraceae bacterium]